LLTNIFLKKAMTCNGYNNNLETFFFITEYSTGAMILSG
jgi:hypothetical protein